ncbi:DUF3060 domain-containing protein [Curtobacterium sp. ISL-83]|uniref:DUF3060 domain-containing protein n=1 Tax=Curtobacterium sp. ISL-83 TaxID=2819145 RepID=UPI001BE96760|nr:DUF3060 domain-containing protein [Curtobacterium sp. ISL-83]MBT2502628.1 DUF3060 domain-containing protein [Curtobacterium sp. ISL-83]
MQKKHLIAMLALATVALAGCSTNADGPDPSRSVKPSAKATSAPVETVYDKCEGGQATVLASHVEKGKKLTLGDCANVSIVGAGVNGATIELGAVDTLVIEGDSVATTVGSAKKIVVAGQKNAVTYGGEAEVQDEGKENTITKK